MVNNNLPIKTLIVDDSVVIRKVLERLFKGDSRFRVVGEAGSCKEALRMIKSMELDLITMDLHMPDGTGLDVIKSYMNLKPVSTVVISSLRPEESNLVLESLENGAIDYIEKPDQKTLLTKKAEILDRLFHASQSKKAIRVSSVKRKALLKWPANSILLIGASTGGVEAIHNVLGQLGSEIPPTLIVQHIPPFFSAAFAERLDKVLPFEVREAKQGEMLSDNKVLIAPGGLHMKLVRRVNQYSVVLEESAPVNRHRPSVDVLFDSANQVFVGPKVGVLLTGMGADGAEGLLKLRESGAFTIAQDEKTSIVFGMPKEAIKRGAALHICGLGEMGAAVQMGFDSFNLLKKSS